MSANINILVTTIKNGQSAFLLSVKLPNKKALYTIILILCAHGLVRGYKYCSAFEIEVLLDYCYNKPVIKEIVQISKPGMRRYFTNKQLKTLYTQQKNVLLIVSSTLGVHSLKDTVMLGVGGELLLKINF